MPRGGSARAAPSVWTRETIVGRDDIVAELVAAADRAARGDGGVVLLTGDAGIGKTSVVRALTDVMRERMDVSWGRCVADRSKPPFFPWRPLLDGLTSDEPAREGPDWAIGASRLDRLTNLRNQLVSGVWANPKLHVIEDLQWADVASVLMLTHLEAGLGGVPLLVVGTLRTGEALSTQLADALNEASRNATVRALTPLSPSDVALLVAATGRPSEDDYPSRLHARTGGNPLFVVELLRVPPSPTSRRNGITEALPERVAELVQGQMARLPAAVTDVLLTAAVIGTDGDTRTLAAAHGAPVTSVLDLLEQARAAAPAYQLGGRPLAVPS